jgi:hypothetical protein
VPSYLGLAIPRYVYGPANLFGRLGCVTFRGRCAIVALPARFGHPGFYVRTKASPWGARPMALPSTSGYLGAIHLRMACLEWLRQTLCSYARYLNVSTLHTFNRFFGFIVDQTQTLQLPLRHHQRPLHVTYLSRFYSVSSDTGHCRHMASLRLACLQGLPVVGPARLLAAMPGDLCVSTLRLIKTIP